MTPAQARTKVRTELDAGRLIRPAKCQRCDCRGRVNAHHADHTKPLDVEWLCYSCHLKIDIPYGEQHHYAKLTLGEVKEVFKLREDGWTMVAMAHLFGVRVQTIGRILKGLTWKRALQGAM